MELKHPDTGSIKLIIGLGNPGAQYMRNRHNIGFRIIEAFGAQFAASWQTKDNMDYAQLSIPSDSGYFFASNLYLVKPLTFMNTSGKVLSHFLKKGIAPEEILVIHDELEKPFGQIQMRCGGSARGHNGLRSIIETIGSDFWRMRFGIGRPADKADVSRYVLSNFLPEEEQVIEERINETIELLLQTSQKQSD